MKAMKAIVGLLTIFIVMPIWYYLLYRVLEGVNASNVMWLLYWVYVPVGCFAHALQNIIEADK